MKTYVRNKSRPEGCMATGTAMEVALGLSTEYILECESTGKRVWDSEEELGDSGEVPATAYKTRNMSSEECDWIYTCVLNNSSCLDSLRECVTKNFDTHVRICYTSLVVIKILCDEIKMPPS